MSDIDPLDAFMASLGDPNTTKRERKGERLYQNEDHEYESVGLRGNHDDAREVEVDDKPIKHELPKIDHSIMQYHPIVKNVYQEHPAVAALSEETVQQLRDDLGISIEGQNIPTPCVSFAHFQLASSLLNIISRDDLTEPSAIQKQAIPCALSGRNIIAIAQTGSGKTLAYLIPALMHIRQQPALAHREGPMVLVLVPTRELAEQVYYEAKRYSKAAGFNAYVLFGGANKTEQFKELQRGLHLLIATPGRLIDIIRMKGTNLQRVSMLILDEADRMLDLGFEEQVTAIASSIRPDRQTLLLSATFPKRIQKLCQTIVGKDVIRINIEGQFGQLNPDIQQHFKVIHEENRLPWLLDHLASIIKTTNVIVFGGTKVAVEELAITLCQQGFIALALHGDMTQPERSEVINTFKKTESNTVLVATDVAARGLDVQSVGVVINMVVPKNVDTYLHRIGRTGRAGNVGHAYTLLSRSDEKFATHLGHFLDSQEYPVDPELWKVAKRRPQTSHLGRKRPNDTAFVPSSKKSSSESPFAGFQKARTKEGGATSTL
jgi:ATP-dependent RNA helicase DDX42